MNKKFLSAILFGALMVTSTGTFVSCKDYDDDIDSLNEKVDKLTHLLLLILHNHQQKYPEYLVCPVHLVLLLHHCII